MPVPRVSIQQLETDGFVSSHDDASITSGGLALDVTSPLHSLTIEWARADWKRWLGDRTRLFSCPPAILEL
jgi:hypothetical protein